MNNPNGPYPGRQIFLGLTDKERPCFAYLVTGRSPASRERKATFAENGLIMGPIGNEPYDWLRHYTAVKTDKTNGIAAVTNGIQTEAIFEAYRLRFHTLGEPEPGLMTALMTGAQYEPDSLHTPRISGVITFKNGENRPVFILSIITDTPPANTWVIEPKKATLTGISTYTGNMEKPAPFDVAGTLPVIENPCSTAKAIAEYVYEMSAATNQGDDIRVCGVGGVLANDNKTWDIQVLNRHK